MIRNCDAIMWASTLKENQMYTTMTFFKMPSKTKATEMGFKYNIILFKNKEDADDGMFKAILGDPRGYIERVGRLGYSGMMFKEKIKLKLEFKGLVEDMLASWGFTKPQIKKAIKPAK